MMQKPSAASQSPGSAGARMTAQLGTKEIFIIHGRDQDTQTMVAGFLVQLGLKPVILAKRASQGLSVAEKFQQHAHIGFVIAVLTPDDIDSPQSVSARNSRTSQNVFFELGYCAGRLGREHVCVLTKGNIDIASTEAGIVAISLDDAEGWKVSLIRELKSAGFDFDASQVPKAVRARSNTPPEEIAAFCKRWRIEELALLGPLLRDEFSLDSNVLVKFEPDHTPGFLRLVDMEAELSDLLGRDVVSITRSAVESSQNTIRRQAILDSAEVIYAG